MASLNKAQIIGRLGKDPELKYTQSGQAVCSISVATDESYTDRNGQRVEGVEWHRVNLWDRMAENCAQYLRKGSLVYIEGSIRTRKWQDQQGQERQTTEIRAQRMQFLGSKGTGGPPAPGDSDAPPPTSRSNGGGNGQGRRNGIGAPRHNYGAQQEQDDLGPAFPSDAGGIDEVPF